MPLQGPQISLGTKVTDDGSKLCAFIVNTIARFYPGLFLHGVEDLGLVRFSPVRAIFHCCRDITKSANKIAGDQFQSEIVGMIQTLSGPS